jgi:hypothetical protein
MRMLRNSVIHAANRAAITSDEAAEFVALARGVVEKLESPSAFDRSDFRDAAPFRYSHNDADASIAPQLLPRDRKTGRYRSDIALAAMR